MKDTKRDKQRKKNWHQRLMRFFLYALLIQMVIAAAYVCVLLDTKPISKEACVSQQIVIEDVQYVRVYGEHVCRITADGVSYDVAQLGISGEYSAYEIYDALEVGDTVNILHIQARRLLGILPYNKIVDIQGQDIQYLTFETYASQKARARMAFHILFLGIEVIFIGLCTLDYLFRHHKPKPHAHRKRPPKKETPD